MPPTPSPAETRAGRLRLLAATTIITTLWLGVWPAIADWPPFRAQIDHNCELGIDPSAKFYTEQPVAAAAVISISAAQRRDAEAWWSVSD
ncbi:MAG: hypothetical protein SFV23_24675 [Planctomycetaceae bacterium]|nr:hypothetical protein [Planctomycetaceae bacterium]